MKLLQTTAHKTRPAAWACFVLLLCAFALAAAPTVRAETGMADDGYTIQNFHVDAVLHANNTVTQTETISVNFSEERHGIFRSLPRMVYLNQDTEKGVERMGYRVKINDVSVEGAPFQTDNDDGMLKIRIGDEDKTVIGPMQYTIRYTYDIGDDRVDAYDSLFYSLNGPDWDTWIENFSFSMQFEKPLPAEALDTLFISSGAYGVEDNSYIEYTVTENGIEGSTVEALPPQTAVTVFARLPEGYFTGERSINMIPAYIALALLVLAGLYTLVRALLTTPSRPVQTVEFYPPAGMTSAEVGFIIDGASDDKDVISLVIWLADQGYVHLAEQGKYMQITRVKALPPDAPVYLHTFFDALFADGATRSLNQLDEVFAKAFADTKLKLTQFFKGPRGLTEHGSVAAATGLPIVCALLFFVFALFAGGFVDSAVAICAGIASVVLLIVSLARSFMESRWIFSTTVGRIGHVVLVAVLGIAGFCITALIWMSTGHETGVITPALVFVPAWTVWGGYLLVLICAIVAPRMVRETQYSVEMTGKLLGLRDFIHKAELPRIQALVEQDPAYFYRVLPYAYVFGLSDKWVEQFETLALQPPDWYTGNDVFTCMYLNQSLRHSLAHSINEMRTISSNSGSGTGGGGGSSGFSGGGFGGGGGGSW